MRRVAGTRLAAAAALLAGAAAAHAFDLQGHRGARGLAPENTLPGFATALGIGVSTLELDVAVTRDGVLVASHGRRLSPELTRDAAGRWIRAPGPVIHALDASELARYDVGRIDPASRYAARFPDQRPADGAAVPALAAVFDLVRRSGNRSVHFNIETKIDPHEPDTAPAPAAFAEALVAALRTAGMLDRASVQSFDWRTLAAVQTLAPALPTVCLSASQRWLDNLERGRPGPSPWTAGLDVDDHGGSAPRLAAAAGCRAWSPFHEEVDAASLAEAHSLGLAVIPWTVNEPARMAALVALGVDGLITDYPDRLRAVLAARGIELPAPSPVNP